MEGGPIVPAPTLATLAGEVARLEAKTEIWEGERRDVARAYRQAIDTLQAEAWRRLIRALRADPGAASVLRETVRDEVVYAVLRHHGILKPSLFERVEAALDSIRPLLAGHGGDVELVRVEPPAAWLRFTGACDTCPASRLTIESAVKTAVQAVCPEITEILQVRA